MATKKHRRHKAIRAEIGSAIRRSRVTACWTAGSPCWFLARSSVRAARAVSWCSLALLPCAAEPTLRNVNVRGLQIGGTTTLIVDGDDLGQGPASAAAVRRQAGSSSPGAPTSRPTFDVTLADDVDAGLPPPARRHRRRRQPARRDRRRSPAAEAVRGRRSSSCPSRCTASSTAAPSSRRSFTGKAGQKVHGRGGSPAAGQQAAARRSPLSARRSCKLAWAWPTPALGGDARLEATLPEDGAYTVALHDAEYAGAGPRLLPPARSASGRFVDQVFPPVVGKGQSQTRASCSAPAPRRVRTAAPAAARCVPLCLAEGRRLERPAAVRAGQLPAGGRGAGGAGKAQDLPAGPRRRQRPAADAATRRIATASPVTPETKVRLEVFAERHRLAARRRPGRPQRAGAELARAEDGPGTLDPVLEYTVPDKVTAIVVGVVDAQGRGGPRGVYRLAIEPQVGRRRAGELPPRSPRRSGLRLPLGGRDRRSGADRAARLPRAAIDAVRRRAAGRGRSSKGTTSPPTPTARWSRCSAATRPSARSSRAGAAEARTARSARSPSRVIRWSGSQPWLATEIAVAPTTAKAADFQIDWTRLCRPTRGWSPPASSCCRSRSTPAEPDSVVRLTLLTSQLPAARRTASPTRTRRSGSKKPVELAAQGDRRRALPCWCRPSCRPPRLRRDGAGGAALAPTRQTRAGDRLRPGAAMLVVRMPVVVAAGRPARIEATLDPKTGATVEGPGQGRAPRGA